ncbi:SIMPL domain-containing protein [Catellatospora methionotrophica]|uniref:SIMPL domain-containing protein n=1 Tax=Catellatospora methionotrophica TaxID=121620 RepID=UPI003408E817
MQDKQMIKQPWGISAYGAASVKKAPDLVRVKLRVVRVEKDPQAAFTLVNADVRAVREVLRGHGVPDSAVDGSRLDLKSDWDWNSGKKRFVGYQCRAAFTVTSANLDSVQALLIDLVGAGASEIDAVEFDVTGKKQLRDEARRRAVEAARAKAELYASAAGVRVGDLLHLEDIDPEGSGTERYKGHGSAPDAADESLAPGHVVVSAAVILGFAITQ